MKLCLDTGHANTNEGPLEYAAKLGDKIACVHVHDNGGQFDEHLDVGKGSVPWKALLAALEKINFHGPYISECFKSQPHTAIERLNSFLP